MNKKYLSVVLFGALLAASAGTFTSCKDYDDDIKGLQEQIDKSGSTITDLQTQLTTLKAAADAAQATADAAKTAADAAKAAGDQAKADAATALAAAKAAEAAAAQAKADAIEEATKQVEALRNSMQAAIDKKLDVTAFEEASKLLGARIDGIEAGLSNLKNGAVKENTEAIKSAQDAIEALQSADEDFATTLKELDEYVKITLEAKIDVNADDIKAAQDDIKAAQEDLDALWKKISGGEGSLEDLISKNATAISDLKDAIEDELDVIKGDIKDIQADIKKINGQITAINQNLAGLHTLVVSRLTSISLAPDLFVDGIEAVRFTSLQYSPMGESENASIPATSYKFSTAALATASYHFNPASFKLANADYGYIDRTAEVVETTRAIAASKLVEIVGEPEANPVTGTVDFKLLRLNSHTTQPGLDRTNMIALQATLKGNAVDEGEKNAVITAPYVAVYDAILSYEDVRIADKETLTTGADEAHYATTFDACTKEDPRYKIPYDKEFNLKDLVATCFGNNGHDEFPIADYKLSYRFAVASTAYNIEEGNTETNQQKWIKCNDAIEGKYQAEGFNPEAFGRTPILKVELVDEAGNVVRRGFVKVEFIAEKESDFTVGNEAKELTFACNATEASYTITEEFIRENVYRKITNGTNIGMSHEEFWNIYTTSTAEVKKNNQVFSMSVPKIVDGTTEVGTATKKIVWEFTHGELKAIGAGGSQFVATITVKNKLQSSKYPDKITFKFIVNVKLPVATLESVKNELFWQNIDGELKFFKVNAEVPDTPEDPADGCLIHQELGLAYDKYDVKGLPTCVTHRYVVTKTYSDGKATSKVLAGVKIDGETISLDKDGANATAVKAALNSAGGLQASVAHIYTLESGDQITVNEFMVNFIRPVSLNMPSGVTLTDAVTGGDIANFQWNGLLMDWSGNAIVSPSVVETEDISSYWKRVCVPEYELTEGHYNIVTPASLKTTTGTVDIVTASPITTYNGSATYTYTQITDGTTTTTKTYTTPHSMVTKGEVSNYLYAQALNGAPAGYRLTANGTVNYTEVLVSAGSSITYTYIASIDYTPAVIEWIPGEPVAKKHDHTLQPNFEGTSYGQKSGCWEWTKTTFSSSVINLGQYWFYYGEFSEVKLDIDKVTTDLKYNGGKLPDKATLEQVGNTVKYVNVKSPIEYAYKIFIPATVNYGWGTLSSTLTITVNPKN
ncbi:cell surface protein [Bacteroides thetaiotaomicron]|uniref:cell surface protein n=1 Tax=Bacteroides thetaiotaomicron TaxID=818 RepID=UPI0019260500|nr:cell surface protein [Bacteroides thetaiotaomicron]MBL3928269.1 cell surface protein [Bacteroides thetaiotaomicron]MBL3955216.1 cell surface protein [Bacteroides thetaiotaomicron]